MTLPSPEKTLGLRRSRTGSFPGGAPRTEPWVGLPQCRSPAGQGRSQGMCPACCRARTWLQLRVGPLLPLSFWQVAGTADPDSQSLGHPQGSPGLRLKDVALWHTPHGAASGECRELWSQTKALGPLGGRRATCRCPPTLPLWLLELPLPTEALECWNCPRSHLPACRCQAPTRWEWATSGLQPVGPVGWQLGTPCGSAPLLPPSIPSLQLGLPRMSPDHFCTWPTWEVGIKALSDCTE